MANRFTRAEGYEGKVTRESIKQKDRGSASQSGSAVVTYEAYEVKVTPPGSPRTSSSANLPNEKNVDQRFFGAIREGAREMGSEGTALAGGVNGRGPVAVEEKQKRTTAASRGKKSKRSPRADFCQISLSNQSPSPHPPVSAPAHPHPSGSSRMIPVYSSPPSPSAHHPEVFEKLHGDASAREFRRQHLKEVFEQETQYQIEATRAPRPSSRHTAGGRGSPSQQQPPENSGVSPIYSPRSHPHGHGMDGADRLYQWGHVLRELRERRAVLAAAQRAEKEMEGVTHHPVISDFARQLRRREGERLWEGRSSHLEAFKKQKLVALREESERRKMENCSFQPKISNRSRRMVTNIMHKLQLEGDLHEFLYNDAKRRQERDKQYKEYIPPEVTFQPQRISKARRSAAGTAPSTPVEGLQAKRHAVTQRSQKASASLSFQKTPFTSSKKGAAASRVPLSSTPVTTAPPDPVAPAAAAKGGQTDREPFTPRTGRPPHFNRTPNGVPIWDVLHGMALRQQQQQETKEGETGEDPRERHGQAGHPVSSLSISTQTDSLMREARRKCLHGLFALLDSNGDGLIDTEDIPPVLTRSLRTTTAHQPRGPTSSHPANQFGMIAIDPDHPLTSPAEVRLASVDPDLLWLLGPTLEFLRDTGHRMTADEFEEAVAVSAEKTGLPLSHLWVRGKHLWPPANHQSSLNQPNVATMPPAGSRGQQPKQSTNQAGGVGGLQPQQQQQANSRNASNPTFSLQAADLKDPAGGGLVGVQADLKDPAGGGGGLVGVRIVSRVGDADPKAPKLSMQTEEMAHRSRMRAAERAHAAGGGWRPQKGEGGLRERLQFLHRENLQWEARRAALRAQKAAKELEGCTFQPNVQKRKGGREKDAVSVSVVRRDLPVGVCACACPCDAAMPLTTVRTVPPCVPAVSSTPPSPQREVRPQYRPPPRGLNARLQASLPFPQPPACSVQSTRGGLEKEVSSIGGPVTWRG